MNRLLNNLSIRTRLLLSITLLVLTLCVALEQAYSGIQANIDFAASEKEGDAIQRPLAKILGDSADLRILLALGRDGHAVADPVAKVIFGINDQMTELKKQYDAVGVDLQFTDAGLGSRGRTQLKYETVAAKWQSLAKAVIDAPAGDNDAALASFIADIRGMISHSGDTSNLILDPDLDSYYLMDVTLLVMPQTIDRLSSIGKDVYAELGSAVTGSNAIETAVYARLLKEGDIDRAAGDMDTSLKEDPNFYGKSPTYEKNILVSSKEYNDKNAALAGMTKNISLGTQIARDEYMRNWQSAKETAMTFWMTGFNELDHLLDIRIAHYVAQQQKVLIVSALGVLVSLLGFFLVIASITTPLKRLIGTMDELASGHLAVDVPYTETRSEIGKIASAMQVFKETAAHGEDMKQAQVATELRQTSDKKRMMQELADSFQAEVGSIVETVTRSAQGMGTTAQSLMRIADDANAKASNVAAASEEASANVQAVASATEELSASIREISQQVSRSNEMASAAKEKAAKSTKEVESLVLSAEKIGVVVKLISDIAEQTNLLALNATIEAARAGDAGKGFAVVASEVKSLATQTANATGQISDQIKAIQDASLQSARAISDISRAIDEMSGITSSVAAAVEEQGAATSEIARNVQEASSGTREVAANIVQVTQATSETGEASGIVMQASNDLSNQSNTLRQAVNRFLDTVRSSA